MINDAYIKNNKTKKQAWLIIPLALFIIVVIVWFGRDDNSTLLQPNILEKTTQGMLIELPLVKADQEVIWHPEWTPTSGSMRQQVLESLSQYAADYKQLRTHLEIQPGPNSELLNKLSQRIGDDLALYNLGRVIPSNKLPMDLTLPDKSLLLVCSEEDSELALRLLTALMPYLGGTIRVHFDSNITAQSMRLYLFGTPYFNDQGQATFDDVAVRPEPASMEG